ncbi:MAG: hypothetical protein JNK66_00065 [Chitinophagales bacterium]|nr:hypothetical protein [Chitinophagales bacterium]
MIKPTIPKQVVLAVAIGLVGMLTAHYGNFENGTEYFAVLVAMIFYVLTNSIVSISESSIYKYTLPSIYSYIAFSAALLLLAKFMSGISIWNLWEYRMMVVSLTFFYFVLSFLVRVIRFVLEISGGEEEQR